ncbi:hypothetical protein ACVWWN_003506 [Mycobacterium sp. URHB0021]|jgi:hypothetical protein
MRTDLKAAYPAPNRVSTATSPGSLSRAPCTGDLSMTSDANMAWLLAIAVDVCLTGHVRTMTFVELGCGEHHLAIKRILNSVMASRMTLPVAVLDRLSRWLDGYAGCPEEPRLRTMLAKIQARQSQPVPSCTQRVRRVDVRSIAAPARRISVA